MAGPRVDRDTCGLLLAVVAAGRDVREVMERDDGFVYSGDPRDHFLDYRHWPRAERAALRLVRGPVLDVSCGAGRVALHLQDRGHEVVAIDESPSAEKEQAATAVLRMTRRGPRIAAWRARRSP